MGLLKTCGYALHSTTPGWFHPRTHRVCSQGTVPAVGPAQGPSQPCRTPSTCPGEQAVPGQALGQANSHTLGV